MNTVRFCGSLVIHCEHDQSATSDPTVQALIPQKCTMKKSRDIIPKSRSELTSDMDSSSSDDGSELESTSNDSWDEDDEVDNEVQEADDGKNQPLTLEWGELLDCVEQFEPNSQELKAFVRELLMKIRQVDGILETKKPTDDSPYGIEKSRISKSLTPVIAVEIMKQTIASIEEDIVKCEKIMKKCEEMEARCRLHSVHATSMEEKVKFAREFMTMYSEFEDLFILTVRANAEMNRIAFKYLTKSRINQSPKLLENMDLRFEALQADQRTLKQEGRKKLKDLRTAFNDKFDCLVEKLAGEYRNGKPSIQFDADEEMEDNPPLKRRKSHQEKPNKRPKIREQDEGAFSFVQTSEKRDQVQEKYRKDPIQEKHSRKRKSPDDEEAEAEFNDAPPRNRISKGTKCSFILNSNLLSEIKPVLPSEVKDRAQVPESRQKFNREVIRRLFAPAIATPPSSSGEILIRCILIDIKLIYFTTGSAPQKWFASPSNGGNLKLARKNLFCEIDF